METTSAISRFLFTNSSNSFTPSSNKWLTSNLIKQDFNNRLVGQAQILRP